MKLNKITIKNYRSIDESIELDFQRVNKSCYFMFGINEAGKSNILKACALLDKNQRSKYNWGKDCFKENKRSLGITEIDYYFNFDSSDKSEIKDLFKGLIPETILNNISGVRYWIEGDVDSKSHTGFKILFEDEKVLQGFLKRKIKVDKSEPDVTSVSSLLINESSDISEIEKDNYRNLEATEIYEIIENLIDDKFIEDRLPKVIHWDSSSKYLIKGTIDLNEFKENPLGTSVPLFNMFKFLKFNEKNIKTGITEALKDPSDRNKLAADLSRETTKHVNTVWKEHKVEVKVNIESSGACDIHFADKDANTNLFIMEDRSDGFQRFMSFILTMSAEKLNEELVNTLILLDEPEVHLHPSGIEYLKYELLNLANENYVLAASHSIFLVDKNCLERHITTTKKYGKTLLNYINSDSPFQEEVIYRALNTSVYELIQPINIIFEGSIDNDIFLATKHKFRSELPTLVNVGGIGATGATEVKKYEKFFKVNLLVSAIAIFDSDTEGRRELGDIQSGSFFEGKAFELKNILDIGKTEFELEDLLPVEVVLNCAKLLYKHDFSSSVEQHKPIMDELKRIKNVEGIQDDKKLEKLKELIVKSVLKDTDPKVLNKEKFKSKYITYYLFLEALQTKIDSFRK